MPAAWPVRRHLPGPTTGQGLVHHGPGLADQDTPGGTGAD